MKSVIEGVQLTAIIYGLFLDCFFIMPVITPIVLLFIDILFLFTTFHQLFLRRKAQFSKFGHLQYTKENILIVRKDCYRIVVCFIVCLKFSENLLWLFDNGIGSSQIRIPVIFFWCTYGIIQITIQITVGHFAGTNNSIYKYIHMHSAFINSKTCEKISAHKHPYKSVSYSNLSKYFSFW